MGVRTNCSSAKSKAHNQRAKKKLSATLLRLLDSEDELSYINWDSVPLNMQEWLSGTFKAKKGACSKKSEGKTNIRSILHSVESSFSAERKFRTMTSSTGMAYPEEVITSIKDIDEWSFSPFALSDASEGQSLKFMMCELFNKYDLLNNFKIPLTTLISFAKALDDGYNKYQNPYHNSIHAADVTQTVHSILLKTGIMHWFSDLEILAMFFSTSIHDYDHNGTSNHFHVLTRSELAFLYNDKSVLENHHVCAAYQLLQNEEMNILVNLTEEEWRELRSLVIRMVIATDMARHFRHINTLRNIVRCMQQKQRPDRAKVMSMIVHAADISHPSKPWVLHHRWAEALMDEFFRQGDKEAELGLPISPLCDRKTTNIAETQIGFIEVIIKPIFFLLLEAVEQIVAPLKHKASKSGCASSSREHGQKASEVSKCEDKQSSSGRSPTNESGTCSDRNILITLDIQSFRENVMQNIKENRNRWRESQKPPREESPAKESKNVEDQLCKGKPGGESPQKESESSTKTKKYCTMPQTPTTCECQLCDNKASEPMDVNFIVYNADSTELLQGPQDADAMEVTESYEELVDNDSSWRKAAGQNVDSNIEEMRGMVPKSKPLSANESDDIIIEEFIPDDPQPQPTNVITCQDEEVLRRAAEQQKQQNQGGIPADAALQVATAGKQNEACQGGEEALARKSSVASFVLQVISFDAPSVSCTIDAGPKQDPCQKEVTTTPVQMNDNTTPASTQQQNEATPCAAATVSVTSLSYGVFKIPQ
ncbi:dual specificity calcium/calmodulin-dependent 3',5'-cyclic nucleotide phosphodiesterase 1A-like isoform X3 [Hemicordylus capensis]|uniref:dual specificity calcium/calmodulin-dependent 3',5'-cyclic nucleotide phosphodiesterase 1A-like isoform X3 n=1 Tax=Hemicordylus capensis TaxID=884348 RepID=UPI00230216B8|nr:dual specificity calcium/calmodulin-dependent 3',5'-cyclic nucleotide phosphodiesterase 1A-like isoform X3 [Hemicordylus capensis]